MGAPSTPLERTASRLAEYVMAKLRKAGDRWPRGESNDLALRVAVLALVAHAIELGREILVCRNLAIAGPLLLRTLWHNAGHLCWLLHGPGSLDERLITCADDQSIRSNEALINRTKSVFGQAASDDWLNNGERQASVTAIQKEAKEARSRQENPKAHRSDWGRLGTPDLTAAMDEVCKTADPELSQPLSLCKEYSEIARLTGDDMAHPNPFVALQVLDLLNPDTENIRRTTEIKNRLLNPTCLLMLLVQLMVLHVAALAKHDPNCISLRGVLEMLGRAWSRAKRDDNP